jgi:hypothetical protein
MASASVAGKMEEYISNIEFSLNFEDKRSSVKVKVGEIVRYDGINAKYIKTTSGEEVVGRTSSLKTAIASNWLTLNVPGALVGPIDVHTDKKRVDGVVYKEADYDPLKGGAFDKLLEKSEDIAIASSGAGRQVIREENQVVKKTNFERPSTATKKTAKMEVSGDQVSVKEVTGTTVSNSTSQAESPRTNRPLVIQADDGQADHIIVGKKKEVTAEAVKKTKTFTVDSSTPSIPEDATLAEVKRSTVKFDDRQDARVISKVGSVNTRLPDEPNEMEGIVLRKTGTEKPSQGSTPVADLSGVKTQSEVDAIEKEIEKKAVVTAPVTKNYVDMLPEDWATLHWVKKEQFISEITDPDFLKFIMRVESIKAVHAACKKRLIEIAKQ